MKEHTLNPELLSLYPNESTDKRIVDRRTFIKTALSTGFALAVAPSASAAAISTNSDGLNTAEVKIPVADGTLPAYYAKPKNEAKPPLILVVQEIFGVHEYIKDVCRRLAKQGYFAVAPELYARQGDPSTMADIATIMDRIVSKVPDQQVLSDLDACVAWAESQSANSSQLGITGFCWGGRIVWLYAAHNPKLKAGVAWYGRLTGDRNELTPKQPLDVAGSIHAPVLGLYAGEDTGIPLTTIDEMREKLKAAKDNSAANTSIIHVYPGVPHAFHADYRPSYREKAAIDGWRRLSDWFKDKLHTEKA